MDLPLWPEWPPRFGVLLFFAVALLATALVGELLGRRAGLPRVTGYALCGLVLGPLVLGGFAQDDLVTWRGVLDLALALLLFELGIRLDLRWFRANPWILASSLAEAALSFVLTLGALLAIGVGKEVALAVAAISVGTSPAIVMRVTAELRAAGQVTERLQALCALNVGYSVILFKLVMGALYGAEVQTWWVAVLHPLYLFAGSLLVGTLVAVAFVGLRRAVDPGTEQGAVAIFGLLLAAIAVLTALRLPTLLAPLLAGLLVKWHDPRPHRWPQHLGTAGGVLVIALFMLSGAAVSATQLAQGLAAALVAVLVRIVAKLGGVMMFGAKSGLGLRKSFALGVALLPLSAVAVLLVEDVRMLYPSFADQLAPVVMSMVAVLGLVGPVATQRALIHAREHRSGDKS
ncbi:sodium:proton antiporter [Azoarcus sp. DD4]|uniref:cation:proton antiporter n=1 Tax=Azoarcus sp. DD4 TaxID=2027405 RepID=UPI00112C5814|nr:cation:proton antiporter [Azoarcus sp. DD4]QDF97651.1 sodium:proton antiporter [Azoarcus sp. DD4]